MTGDPYNRAFRLAPCTDGASQQFFADERYHAAFPPRPEAEGRRAHFRIHSQLDPAVCVDAFVDNGYVNAYKCHDGDNQVEGCEQFENSTD